MGKQKKNHPKKPKINPADKRPWQLFVLLVICGVGFLSALYLWYFYTANHIVGGNSVPVPSDAIPVYRILLLVSSLISLALGLSLFFGVKASFWITLVWLILDTLGDVRSLNLLALLLDGFALYCLLCESTRIYFRIGQFKAFGPRKK